MLLKPHHHLPCFWWCCFVLLSAPGAEAVKKSASVMKQTCTSVSVAAAVPSCIGCDIVVDVSQTVCRL
jgi:hypothetical protein